MSVGDDIKKLRISLNDSLLSFFSNSKSDKENQVSQLEKKLINYIDNTMLSVLSDIDNKINISIKSMEDFAKKTIKDTIDSRHSILMDTDKGEIYKYIDSAMIPIKRDLNKFVSDITDRKVSKIHKDISDAYINTRKNNTQNNAQKNFDITSDKVKYKINTDLIREKILSAVDEKKQAVSNKIDSDIQNIMSSRINIDKFYNQRGFFDGISIFGIYNPNLTIDQINGRNFGEIHVYPKCEKIEPNLEYIKTINSKNHIIIDDNNVKSTSSYDLRVCKDCLKNFNYHETNVKIEKFCQDFLFGVI